MFWDNFIFYCNKKGVAPNVAASDVGVKSSGTVTGWKNGAIPRQGVLKRLADYFCVSVSDLIGDQKEKPASSGDEPDKEQLLNMVRNSTDMDFLLSVLNEVNKKLQENNK